MTQTIRIAADDTRSPIRALNSLTPTQADQIVAGLSSLAYGWDIERHESCNGVLSLVLVQAACDTALVVDHDHAGIHVSLLLNDKLITTRHRYANVNDALHAIKTITGNNAHNSERHSA